MWEFVQCSRWESFDYVRIISCHTSTQSWDIDDRLVVNHQYNVRLLFLGYQVSMFMHVQVTMAEKERAVQQMERVILDKEQLIQTLLVCVMHLILEVAGG